MHLSNSTGKVRDLPPPTYHKGRKPPESGPQQQSTARAKKGDCFRCGGKQEPSLRAYECCYCKKKGHLTRRGIWLGSVERDVSSRLYLQKAHYVVDAPLLHVSSGYSAPLYITVAVNGCPLAMEIDTGASVSIACLETLKDIREGGALAEAGRAYHLAVDVHWGVH